MNSIQRKKLRYERRKNKRLQKVIERSNMYADINKAFCFSKAMYYGDRCCKGVGYKKSTQYFKLHMFTIISNVCRDIKNNNYKVLETYNFIKDRLVHKILSNEIIYPLYISHLIYDNGASLKGKGFKFSMDRLRKMLYSWYLKKGLNGYIVFIDFSKFFENCSHEVIHNIHNKYIINKNVIKVIEDYLFIKEGISLGVEIAQREAIIIPNILDHYIQNITNINRYMDDTIFFVNTYKEGKILFDKYCKIAENLNIKINYKKSFIAPINRSFKYCNWKYRLYESGKIICKPCINTIKRQKKKLKKMIKLSINEEEIEYTRIAFNAYLALGNAKI